MATLNDIQKQIAKLEKQAEAIVKVAAAEAAKKARELIERYKLTAEDVGLAVKSVQAVQPATVKPVTVKKASTKPRAAAVAAAPKVVGAPKFRNPATGVTWTGRGKPPGWIAKVKDRAAFLINAPAAAKVAEAAPVPEVAAPAKATAKAASGATKAKRKAVVRKAVAPAAFPISAVPAVPPVVVAAKAADAPAKKAVARKPAARKAPPAAAVVVAPAAEAVAAAATPPADAAN